jgi:anti-sigma regulatory factor (Ser/Thr protein kinase)
VPAIRAIAVDYAATRCDARPELVSDIALCVSEAAANVVAHAYPQTPGDITLAIGQSEQTLMIRISDDGVGATHRGSQPGLGVGLQIIESLSDACFESADGGGFNVTMRFTCGTFSADRVTG